jgi:hypothetical protein
VAGVVRLIDDIVVVHTRPGVVAFA